VFINRGVSSEQSFKECQKSENESEKSEGLNFEVHSSKIRLK
jgi:hypothetical protein